MLGSGRGTHKKKKSASENYTSPNAGDASELILTEVEKDDIRGSDNVTAKRPTACNF